MSIDSSARNVKGILGTKVGMTQVWDDNNNVVPVTVIQSEKNVVTQVINEDKEGYNAVQLGYGHIDPRKVTKPIEGHFKKAGVTPRKNVTEVRTADASSYEVGQEIGVDIFEDGQLIDVVGTTKGHGFAGGMKRHGFGGGPASHGAHKIHRKPGSIGNAATPSRVFKGKRMPGRMGHDRHTVMNLTVQSVDTENNLLLVKGAIPGTKGSVVFVRNAVKNETKEG